MGWKEREKGKENRGRGLKENRKQGMKLGKGTNRIRKGKEINQDAHTGIKIHKTSGYPNYGLTILTYFFTSNNQRL